jgi:hypothetical protein
MYTSTPLSLKVSNAVKAGPWAEGVCHYVPFQNKMCVSTMGTIFTPRGELVFKEWPLPKLGWMAKFCFQN